MDSLDISFKEGFTVFTGETGAGKSIFLDAIDLLLGGTQVSSVARLLKVGSERCLIEGCFQQNSIINSWLSSNGFDTVNNEVLISREWKFVDNRWKSKSKINGKHVNKSLIVDFKSILIDITFQGAIHKLNSPTAQLEWIDKLGSDSTHDALIKVSNSWFDWHKTFQKLQRAKQEYELMQSKHDLMLHKLNQLDMAELDDPLEDNALKIEEDRLFHSVRLQETIHSLFNYLKESANQFPSVLDMVSICMKDLKIVSELDNSLIPQFDKIVSLNADLNDLIADLDNYYSLLDTDPSQLTLVQERRMLLNDLQSRYNLNLEELIAYRDKLRNALSFDSSDSTLESLIHEEELARAKRDRHNRYLSSLRENIASEFEGALIQYFSSLGMVNASFKVQITPTTPSQNGADEIMFLFSANPGQPLAPLTEVASGGELSRFLLALKATLAEVDGSNTLIFDEIDTGVSGRVSSSIATLLKKLSASRQVFCVTHQPLIAAVADHHFSISKISSNGSTSSNVKELQGFEERQRELAELAGGNFEEASLYAASLLDKKAA